MFKRLLGFLSTDLAIDLGTANTQMFVAKKGIVLDEPTVVAIRQGETGRSVAAIGIKAKEMLGRTPVGLSAIRPLKDGVIADFQAAEKLIEGLINMIGTKRNFFSHLKMVICIPSGITEVEKRAVFDSADHVDSKETYLIHEPMAAALGIGLDVEEPVGHIIIDIGGGTTEIAVIAMSGIVTDQSIRTAGDEFNYDIMEYMKRAHNILIGERTLLNIASRLSGVATHTRRWADQLEGTGAMVLDTRKTTPGMRHLEKYAVRAGGGTNKRMGLYDCAMIKDNHKLAAGSVSAAYQAIRRTFPEVDIQVEVTTVAEALEAYAVGARFIMCDNMSVPLLAETVAALRAQDEPVEIEATGGLTLEVAREYALTGVDYLSVGGLTHSSPILDIALDLAD